jgi:hydroxyacylglutathione hydrolase
MGNYSNYVDWTNMNIVGLPALVDTYENYIWILYDQNRAWVVDPGESKQVIDFLNQHQLNLEAILVTHAHFDHIDGIPALKLAYPQCTVYGPAKTQDAIVEIGLSEGDVIPLTDEFSLKVLETPGHTANHISFYNEIALFCGDTLFTGGCGKILGGTVDEFSQSMLKIRALADSTAFYCAHEYTADNLQFAVGVEPDNKQLQQRFKQPLFAYPQNHIGPLSTLLEEKNTNPFLRFDSPEIKAQLIKRGATDSPSSLFQTLREWKDQYDQQS